MFSVYPCVYREHAGIVEAAKAENGLSLCIQGTLFLQMLAQIAKRFIPVYTGNTINENALM